MEKIKNFKNCKKRKKIILQKTFLIFFGIENFSFFLENCFFSDFKIRKSESCRGNIIIIDACRSKKHLKRKVIVILITLKQSKIKNRAKHGTRTFGINSTNQ